MAAGLLIVALVLAVCTVILLVTVRADIKEQNNKMATEMNISKLNSGGNFPFIASWSPVQINTKKVISEKVMLKSIKTFFLESVGLVAL